MVNVIILCVLLLGGLKVIIMAQINYGYLKSSLQLSVEIALPFA